MFKLERPIVFFDLETTGTEKTKDRIVEISILKIYPDGHKETKTRLINPEMPISKGASDVNHITDEMLINQPTFKKVAKSLLTIFEGCDVGGYNVQNFDLPILAEEFLRVGIEPVCLYEAKVVEVLAAFMKLNTRTLSDAYKHYTGKDLDNAHGASADTEAVFEVFNKMLEVDKDKIGDTMDSVVKFIDRKNYIDFGTTMYRDENGELIFNIGKYKGKKVLENLSFLSWMLEKDFSLNTKSWARKILAGEFK